MAWWPFVFDLQIAALSRFEPGAGIARGYALHYLIGSWVLGMFVAVPRGVGAGASRGRWIVSALAALPLLLIVAGAPVALAQRF